MIAFFLVSIIAPLRADIVVRLPGQDERATAPKRVFILNEKANRLTYVDLVRKSPGFFEGRIKVDPPSPKIAESYRLGLPGAGEKRYFTFSYLTEGSDLVLDLEPVLITLDMFKKSRPIDVTPKPDAH